MYIRVLRDGCEEMFGGAENRVPTVGSVLHQGTHGFTGACHRGMMYLYLYRLLTRKKLSVPGDNFQSNVECRSHSHLPYELMDVCIFVSFQGPVLIVLRCYYGFILLLDVVSEKTHELIHIVAQKQVCLLIAFVQPFMQFDFHRVSDRKYSLSLHCNPMINLSFYLKTELSL